MDAYLAGLLYGDGTLHRGKNKAYAVWIDQHERNNKIVDIAVKKLKAENLNVHHYGFLNKIRALVYSKAMYIEFQEIRSNVSKYFQSLSEKNKWQFISGFFDAEGTVTDRLVLYNSNTSLLRVIQNFLKRKGITSYIYRFGKIHGLQIYRKSDVNKIRKKLNSVKIKNSALSG